MSFISGRLAFAEISADNGNTWIRLGNAIDLTVNLNMSEIDGTSHDSGGDREFAPNLRDTTVDGTVHYDDFDTGAAIMLQAFANGSTYQMRFRLQALPGARLFVFTVCFATKISVASPLADTTKATVSIRTTKPQFNTQ